MVIYIKQLYLYFYIVSKLKYNYNYQQNQYVNNNIVVYIIHIKSTI